MSGRFAALTVISFLLFLPARAGDALEPAGPSAERHERALTGVFAGLFQINVQVRAVVERAGAPQFAVGIEHQGDEYRIFAINALNPQWSAIEDANPAAPNCELAVMPEIARAILEVWKAMLLGMRSQLDTNDIDGAVYYFSMDIDGALRIGRATEQLPSSRAGQLISLANAMHDACRTKSALALRRIPAITAGLRGELATPQ